MVKDFCVETEAKKLESKWIFQTNTNQAVSEPTTQKSKQKYAKICKKKTDFLKYHDCQASLGMIMFMLINELQSPVHNQVCQVVCSFIT